SFLFLFALITGLLLHWDKIKSNFFLFRPWSKWKTVWTDMHTVLGIIGFPFQLVFAITGVVLIVNFFIISPFSKLLYDGEDAKLYQDLQYNREMKVDYIYRPLDKTVDFNAFVADWQQQWNGSKISRLYIRNYMDESMEVIIESKPDSRLNFAGSGYARVQMKDGKVLETKSPNYDTSQMDRVKSLVYHLHFGDVGGRRLRIVFFLLGLTGCGVILSGIMIWLVARDKPNIPVYKRRFNFWAANVFLAICLAMLPVTAFTLIMVKMLNKVDQSVIYSVYFYSWLVLSVYLVVLRNLTRINKHTLLLSVVLCFLVPLANGLSTGQWLWNTFAVRAYDIFFIDLLFMMFGLGCAFAYYKVKKDGKAFKVSV